jgi:hypothetical protein
MRATRGAALLLALLAGCFDPVLCVTASGVELAREPAPAVGCLEVERWTGEVAAAFTLSSCPEVVACDVRALLRRAHREGSGARLYWRYPPLCWGRVMWADRADRYRHQLAHAVFDGCQLAPWPMGGPSIEDHEHHRLMCRCLPELAGEALCKRIAR